MLIGQKLGEVNELGIPHEAPVLQALTKAGEQNGNVIFIEENWAESEVDPKFRERLRDNIDKHLGDRKPLSVRNAGLNLESHLLELDDRNKFIALINWGKPVSAEVGLNLPKGNYQLLGLSMNDPENHRSMSIGGKKTLSEELLKSFAVTLPEHEVLVIKVERK